MTDPSALILSEVMAMRADVQRLREEVATVRGELGTLRQSLDEQLAGRLRTLWDEGLASGDAGELDAVLDEIAAAVPRRMPAA
jgi:hypothetical protein